MCRSRCPSAMNSVKAAWSIPGGWRLTEVRATQPKDGAVLLGLPQFVDPRAGPTSTQILTFAIAFVVLGFITNSLFGWLGGKLGDVARSNSAFQAITRFASGTILIALGVVAAYMPALKRSP